MEDQNINPLLDKVKMPGETFTIPSGGLFYTNGELDAEVQHGELYIEPMTAIDDILLKSPDALFSGMAIDRVFKKCIPQVHHPLKLLARDVDFLLACLRKVSYGDQMEITYTHTCKDAKEHGYIIDMTEFITKSKRIDPSSIKKSYSILLDNGQYVKLRPIRFDKYIELMQLEVTDPDITPETLKENLIKAISGIILQVDEVTTEVFIIEWLDVVAPKVLNSLRTKAENAADWGPEFKVDLVCKDCEEKIQISIPLNPISFFT